MKGHPVSLTRYQRDLEARGLRPNTVRTYVRTVAEFLQALGGPPSRAREKDVRNYVVALQQQRASSSVNVAIAAIACFYVETLRRPAVVARLRRVRVTRHRLEYPELTDDARRVLEKLAPIEREVHAQHEWYIVRILPYRTVDDHIAGVVLTFVDITSRKAVEEEFRQSQERLRLIVENARDYAIFSLDLDRCA